MNPDLNSKCPGTTSGDGAMGWGGRAWSRQEMGWGGPREGRLEGALPWTLDPGSGTGPCSNPAVGIPGLRDSEGASRCW